MVRLARLINLKGKLFKSFNIVDEYIVKFFTWDAHFNSNILCF